MLALFRADAGARTGAGHVMRCLALAQALRDDGGRAAFASTAPPPALAARLAAEGGAVVPLAVEPGSRDDARRTAALAADVGADWVVVDGYHFDDAYEHELKRHGVRLLAFDDYGHAGHAAADVVLNQNLHAAAGLYPRVGPSTRLLLGTRFVLLRREFQAWRGWQRQVPGTASKVLVTLGGTDPDNVTMLVLEGLKRLTAGDIEAVVVIGGDNPRYGELAESARETGGAVRVLRDVADMPSLMAGADVAVGAGGTTAWERAFFQLPGLIIVLADNQCDVADRLVAVGAAWSLGLASKLTAEAVAARLSQLLGDARARVEMAEAAGNLVDGRGADRVVAELRRRSLRLRPAVPDDCRLLWRWANDPAVRTSAFTVAPIPWDEHTAWLAGKLRDPACFLYVLLDGRSRPVGQIRFDLRDGHAEVDVSLDATCRGLGYGSRLIELGLAELGKTVAVRRVHARVKPNNDASRRAFLRVGFRENGPAAGPPPAIHLTWVCDG